MDYSLVTKQLGTKRLPVSAFSLLLLAMACGTDQPDTADEAEQEALRADDPLHAASIIGAESWCTCYWEASYDNEADCVTRRSSATDVCEADVLTDNAGARPRIECLVSAAVAQSECIDNGMCSEADTIASECAQQEREAIEECPAYPDEVQSALSDCIQPEPYWMVADDGFVFGIDAEGVGRGEPAVTMADLNAITCDGDASAWIVGEGGVVLRTDDGGGQWDLGTTNSGANLRAVAQRDGQQLAAVGDAGAFLLSVDGGQTWSAIDAPDRDFTGVTPTSDGSWILSAQDGTISKYTGATGLSEVYGDRRFGLFAVSAEQLGSFVVAVGAAGTVLTSVDSGETWRAREALTSHHLFTVQALEGEQIIAAGAGGVVVRLWPNSADVQVAGDEGRSILGMHVTASGIGGAVGERGTFLQTRDGGETWFARDLGITANLRGLDQPFRGD